MYSFNELKSQTGKIIETFAKVDYMYSIYLYFKDTMYGVSIVEISIL